MAYEQFKLYEREITEWLDFKRNTTPDDNGSGEEGHSLMFYKSRDLPATKHLWLMRLVEAKIELRRLKEEIDDLRKQLNAKTTSQEIAMSKESRAKLIQNFNESPVIKGKLARITELEDIITYLDSVKFILKDTTMDINNYTKMKAMENC